LSARLRDLGQPIGIGQLSKLELGQRRVDADDLVALALALDVSPVRLLLDPVADHEPLEITPVVGASRRDAWRWATGEAPLPTHGAYDMDRHGRWIEENQPHVERDEMTLTELAKHADVLAPLARAAHRAWEAKIPDVTIMGYLRMARTMYDISRRASDRRAKR